LWIHQGARQGKGIEYFGTSRQLFQIECSERNSSLPQRIGNRRERGSCAAQNGDSILLTGFAGLLHAPNVAPDQLDNLVDLRSAGSLFLIQRCGISRFASCGLWNKTKV
jgi:hypothetical protein